MTNCPLCKTQSEELLEVLDSSLIERLYSENLGINIHLRCESIKYLRCQKCDLRFFSPNMDGDELLYERLQQEPWYYMQEKWEFQFAKQYVSDKDAILEVGAGRGAFAAYAKPANYLGLEFSSAAIDMASKSGVKVIKQSIEAHSAEGHQYDAVVTFQVLEHVAEPLSFLASCANCVKPGGLLIVGVPGHDGFSSKSSNNLLDMPPHHLTHWTEASLRHAAGIMKFQVLQIAYEPLASYHVEWAKATLAADFIRRVFNVRRRVLDNSFVEKIVALLAGKFGKYIRLRSADMSGHTVVAVFRKPVVISMHDA